MALCWPSLILLAFAFLSYADAATNFTLTDELTDFVPACAQECFISFLDTNFQTSGCSDTPSLDCLCSHNTTTGYTVGEGAVQCILGEANTGFCKGNDASQTVAIEAFQMCNGQAGALPETHGTITATLIVETSMPSIVLVAPAAETTMPSGMTTLTTVPKTSISAIPSATISAPASASNTTIPAVSGPKPTKLTQNQIIGIGAGIASAGVVCVCAIMLILFFQKRKTRKLLEARESDMLPFQMDPEFYGAVGPVGAGPLKGSPQPAEKGARPGGRTNKAPNMTSPPSIPLRLEISTPNNFSRSSVLQETIGLAISPDHSIAPERTPKTSTPLLPEKPILKLMMPPPPRKQLQPQRLPVAQNLNAQSGYNRQSSATQFELDDDSADTAVNSDNAWGGRSTERILNNTKTLDAEFSTNAITVMKPNEFIWRPPSTSPTNKPASTSAISRNLGSFSQPRKPDEYARLQRGQQPEPPNSDLVRVASSVYSGHGSVSASDGGRNSAPRAQNYYGQFGPYDTQLAEPFKSPKLLAKHEEDARHADLSPVVESPASGGKSPVTYPKIPKRLSTLQMMLPPPPQPDFTKALGAKGTKPWRQAELVTRRDLERHAYEQPQETPSEIEFSMLSPGQGLGHQKVTSKENNTPATRTFNFPAPPPPERSQNRPIRQPPQAVLSNPRKPSSQPRKTPSPPPAPLSERKPLTDATGGFGPGSLIPFVLSSPQPLNINPNKRSSTTSRPSINPLSAHPSIGFTRTPSLLSQSSKISSNSNASTLLAKRRGERQAKELMLANEDDKRRQQSKWRVLKREEIEMAKKEGWRPRLGSPAAGEFLRGSSGEGKSGGGPFQEFEFERTNLPLTPGWIPKLTPTRRGEDLFLNVQ